MEDSSEIDFLSDRIKPYVRLKMSDGGWAEWPQGVFLLSTPTRKIDAAGIITREVEAYDQLVVLRDDLIADRYTVASNTNYITAVGTILTGAGITSQNLTSTDKTLPTDKDWPPGTAKLKIVNELLSAINYRSLWFNESGQAMAEPYVSPSTRPAEYTYRDNQESVIFPEVEETFDLFSIPNRWVLVVSEPDREPLTASYTNDSPSSPTSTVGRGRTITDFRQVDAADQDSLDDRAERLAFEASQVYQSVELDTGIMPMHSNGDVLELQFSALGIAHKYSEQSWEMELKSGGKMSHRVRRVITI